MSRPKRRSVSRRDSKKIHAIVTAQNRMELFRALRKTKYFAGKTAEYWEKVSRWVLRGIYPENSLTPYFGLRDTVVRIKKKEEWERNHERRRREALTVLQYQPGDQVEESWGEDFYWMSIGSCTFVETLDSSGNPNRGC